MPQVEKLKIFLASPSDVAKERRYVEEVIKDINDTVASSKDIVLELVHSEKAYPGYGQDGQAVLNAQIASMEEYALFVGIMWNRVGTPTPRAESGTIEEFERAIAAFERRGQPHIWFYFREAPTQLNTEGELEQRRKVLEFKKKVQRNALTREYKNPSGFRDRFRKDILLWLKEHDNKTSQHIGNWELSSTDSKQGEKSPASNHFQRIIQTVIEDKTKDFVGREYVFEAIADFIDNQPNGYFTIEADPGVGKSAILAKYIQQHNCIAHFNVRLQSINRTAQFLESVCRQLIDRYDLPYPSLPPETTRDSNFFAQLLHEVTAKLGESEKLVIAIDALDEVDLASQDASANILYLPACLPKAVYFLMTQRRITLPFVVHSPQHLFNLMEYRDQSRRDVEDYIRDATRHPKLREWIDKRELTLEEFVNPLADKSENNFMYLRYILPQIEQGFYQNLKIENLPKGLEGYYEDHWRRMGMTAKPLPRTKLKIVYILGEICQPVSRCLISEYAKEDQLTVQEVLDEWEQFLREQEIDNQKCYNLYHASFLDFLHRKNIVKAAGVDIKNINAIIANRLWEGLFGNE
ncbi:MAG: AAA family ATPase [Microcoleus sp.]